MALLFDNFSDWNHGISDPEFFWRKKLWSDEFSVLSVQPLLKLPSLTRDSTLPRSGTEKMDAELRLLGGHGFEDMLAACRKGPLKVQKECLAWHHRRV